MYESIVPSRYTANFGETIVPYGNMYMHTLELALLLLYSLSPPQLSPGAPALPFLWSAVDRELHLGPGRVYTGRGLCLMVLGLEKAQGNTTVCSSGGGGDTQQ